MWKRKLGIRSMHIFFVPVLECGEDPSLRSGWWKKRLVLENMLLCYRTLTIINKTAVHWSAIPMAAIPHCGTYSLSVGPGLSPVLHWKLSTGHFSGRSEPTGGHQFLVYWSLYLQIDRNNQSSNKPLTYPQASKGWFSTKSALWFSGSKEIQGFE